MSNYNKNETPKSRKKLIIISVVTLLLVVAVGTWRFSTQKNTTAKAPEPQPGSVADVSRPTTEEKQAADDQKAKNVERTDIEKQAEQTPAGQKKAVTPIITFASQADANLEVGAFVPGVYEDGGTCTLTAKNGSATVTKTTTASKNATTTDCKNLVVAASEFSPKGNWDITITYQSATAQGTSQVKTVSIR